MSLVDARILVIEVDANAVAVLRDGVVGGVEVAAINIDGDGVFDASRIKAAARY